MDHPHADGQQFVDDLVQQGVGLPAAHFHDPPGPRRRPPQLRQQLPGEHGSAVVEIPHGVRTTVRPRKWMGHKMQVSWLLTVGWHWTVSSSSVTCLR
ncbi:hypothetical protein AB0G32_11730 [Streptomyces sp. NPDC023723]|uniref:hypothetical protein n=1 Tax=Streptomyces sp. NPDC023723 TaxID=3154323 RepID=UPI0033E218EC